MFYRRLLTRVLTWYIKQLYYSEIHLKNIEICLSMLYIVKYSEFNDVIKYMQETSRLLIVLTVGALLIISRVQVAIL